MSVKPGTDGSFFASNGTGSRNSVPHPVSSNTTNMVTRQRSAPHFAVRRLLDGITPALHTDGKGLVITPHISLILRCRLLVDLGLLATRLVLADDAGGCADRGTLAGIATDGLADHRAACGPARHRRTLLRRVAVVGRRRLIGVDAGLLGRQVAALRFIAPLLLHALPGGRIHDRRRLGM